MTVALRLLQGGCGEAGVAERVELGAVELLERTAERVKAKGLAFLEDKSRGLSPDFDNEWFGHVHLLRPSNRVDMVTSP